MALARIMWKRRANCRAAWMMAMMMIRVCTGQILIVISTFHKRPVKLFKILLGKVNAVIETATLLIMKTCQYPEIFGHLPVVTKHNSMKTTTTITFPILVPERRRFHHNLCTPWKNFNKCSMIPII